jgi:hypothetical protein
MVLPDAAGLSVGMNRQSPGQYNESPGLWQLEERLFF